MLAALDDEARDWVKSLQNKRGGPCCDTADGFPVEVNGWDMAGTVDDTSAMTQWEANDARSGYRVRLADGKWHDVPNFALIDPKTNKLGYAVVWLSLGNDYHPRVTSLSEHVTELSKTLASQRCYENRTA
jgi:hypothetical protein